MWSQFMEMNIISKLKAHFTTELFHTFTSITLFILHLIFIKPEEGEGKLFSLLDGCKFILIYTIFPRWKTMEN